MFQRGQATNSFDSDDYLSYYTSFASFLLFVLRAAADFPSLSETPKLSANAILDQIKTEGFALLAALADEGSDQSYFVEAGRMTASLMEDVFERYANVMLEREHHLSPA